MRDKLKGKNWMGWLSGENCIKKSNNINNRNNSDNSGNSDNSDNSYNS